MFELQTLRRCKRCGTLNNRFVNDERCCSCGHKWPAQLRILTTVAPANGVEVSR